MLGYCFICLYWLASMQVAQPADLEFGRAQVEQLMRDRPEVKPVLLKQEALRKHLERNFGGLDTGVRVRWENEEPTEVAAQFRPPSDGKPGCVQVTKDSSVSASDKCVMLVVELEHARNDKRGNAIHRMAFYGQMSREDYARSNAHLEFQSVQRAREFFRQHPLPPSKTSSYYNGLLRFPTEFSDYLKSLSDKNNPNPNLVEYYRQEYDKLVSKRKYDVLKMIPTP